MSPSKASGKKAVLHLRWQGGVCEDIPVTVPPSYYDQIRYLPEVVDRVRVLAHDLPDSQIAEHLNKEGVTSAKGTGFTRSVVSWIRYAHQIPLPVLKLPGEAHRQRDRRKVRRKPPRGVLLDRAQGGLGTEASGWGAVLHQPGSGETKGTRSMGDRLTEDLEAEIPKAHCRRCSMNRPLGHRRVQTRTHNPAGESPVGAQVRLKAP